MKYRLCRVELVDVGERKRWSFTLPISRQFDTLKEAYQQFVSQQQVMFKGNQFWIQEIAEDGTVGDIPNPNLLDGFQQPGKELGANLPVSVPVSQTTADWTKKWGHPTPAANDGAV